jgi:hypothetical protein
VQPQHGVCSTGCSDDAGYLLQTALAWFISCQAFLMLHNAQVLVFKALQSELCKISARAAGYYVHCFGVVSGELGGAAQLQLLLLSLPACVGWRTCQRLK